jgi:hypothetical protein
MSRALQALLVGMVMLGGSMPLMGAPTRLATGQGVEFSIVRTIAALALGCLVALAAVLTLRMKRGGGGTATRGLHGLRRRFAAVGNGRIAVVESRRLTMHCDVTLLCCDGVDYLIASNAHGMMCLNAPSPRAETTIPSPTHDCGVQL